MNVEEIQTSNHNAPTPLVVAVVPVINVDKKDILQENVLMPTPGLKKAKMIVGTTQGKKAQIQVEKTTLGGNFQTDAAEMTFQTIKRKTVNSFANGVDDGSKSLLKGTQIDVDIPDN